MKKGSSKEEEQSTVEQTKKTPSISNGQEAPKVQETMGILNFWIHGLVSTAESKKTEPKWTPDSRLEDIVKEYYSSPEQKQVVDEDIELLKKNRLFTLKQWKDLSVEDRKNLCNHTITQFPIPIPLRKILDEAAGEGIIHFQLIF